jgi:hypothetical protein
MSDTYRCKVTLTDTMRSFVQACQGVGAVVGFTEESLVVELECDDRYDLGTTVRELQQELTAMACESIEISKPELHNGG